MNERLTDGAEPTFSVVMPAYNTGFLIESGLRSVLLQSRSDFELIIVDDGSSDDTAERVAAFEEIRGFASSDRKTGGPRRRGTQGWRSRVASS